MGGGAHANAPAGPYVELPVGHDTCEGCTYRNGSGGANASTPLGPYVKFPMGHEAREGCADMGATAPCQHLF